MAVASKIPPHVAYEESIEESIEENIIMRAKKGLAKAALEYIDIKTVSSQTIGADI